MFRPSLLSVAGLEIFIRRDTVPQRCEKAMREQGYLGITYHPTLKCEMNRKWTRLTVNETVVDPE